MTSTRRPLKVFFSYSHQDEELRDQLEAHLATLKKLSIVTWHDRKIRPGTSWKGEIDQNLDDSDLILLLVSSDFLNSGSCDAEVARAMERYHANEAAVIPIALRRCNWTGAPFSSLQGLPMDLQPVTSWANQDEAFTNVSRGIWRAIEQISGPIEPSDFLAAIDHPKEGQPSVSMSLRLTGTLRGQIITYLASQAEVGEYRVDSGTGVILEVLLDSAPPEGYAGCGIDVLCPTMAYDQAIDSAQEIFWPDSVFAAKAYTPQGLISHGCVVGIQKTASHYIGLLLRLSLRCPLPSAAYPHSHVIYLLGTEDSGSGTCLVHESLEVTPVSSTARVTIPELGTRELAAVLTVTCVPGFYQTAP